MAYTFVFFLLPRIHHRCRIRPRNTASTHISYALHGLHRKIEIFFLDKPSYFCFKAHFKHRIQPFLDIIIQLRPLGGDYKHNVRRYGIISDVLLIRKRLAGRQADLEGSNPAFLCCYNEFYPRLRDLIPLAFYEGFPPLAAPNPPLSCA